MLLPEMRHKASHRCRDCRFLIRLRGREETRWGCVAGIKKYGTLEKRVPKEIHVLEVLKLVGREGLEAALSRGNPDAQACGQFKL